ncbi:MAG: hypothetical protein IKR86_09200 [Candidatus Methanomethylophilaceae archaeon]|nr:hypothetical protein [Candidatus Methanomethylophilaceae archaeon]
MIVRTALMDDGKEFEVPSAAVLGCFGCGYVYGWDAYGGHVLNVTHIVRFGPCRESQWVKETGI